MEKAPNPRRIPLAKYPLFIYGHGVACYRTAFVNTRTRGAPGTRGAPRTHDEPRLMTSALVSSGFEQTFATIHRSNLDGNKLSASCELQRNLNTGRTE